MLFEDHLGLVECSRVRAPVTRGLGVGAGLAAEQRDTTVERAGLDLAQKQSDPVLVNMWGEYCK